jgi:hypothetical protein
MQRRPRHLLAAFAAWLAAGACSAPAAPPGADAEVYAAVLDALYAPDDGGARRLVVVRETRPAFRAADAETGRLPAFHRERLPGLRPATERAFLHHAQTTRPLPEYLPTRLSVAWIPGSAVEKLLRTPPGAPPDQRWWWREWKLRGSNGVVVFSEVGFDADSTQALVYHAFACPDLCGFGEYVLAERRGGRWVVAGRSMDVIS